MKVLTCAVNNYHYIEIQYNTLKRYMKCDYEFIVFNDAKSFPDFSNFDDVTIRDKIRETCVRLGIKCVDIQNDHHVYSTNPSGRTADSMNIMWQYQLANPDKYLIIDSDMFLIDNFDPKEYDNYSCAVVLQNHDGDCYIWNGLVYFDMDKIRDKHLMNWGTGSHDTGGQTQEWLAKQTTIDFTPEDLRYKLRNGHVKDSVYFYHHLWSISWADNEMPESVAKNEGLRRLLKEDPRNEGDKYFMEVYANKFLHVRAGGNWRREGQAVHKHVTEGLYSLFCQKQMPIVEYY